MSDDATSSRDEVVEATVDDVLYRSDDGRYAVVKVTRTQASPGQAELTAVGDLGEVAIGETLRLRGRFVAHRTYGMRFQVDSFVPILPDSPQGVARYLGSGLVKGIGPGLAERIVERFGVRTLDVIATQSQKLLEVSGVGRSRAEALAEAVRSRRAESEALSFLHATGLGPSVARRVLKRFGNDAARIVREDPYRIAEQVPGVGFQTADALAKSLGIADDDPRRAAGVVLHLVGRAADEGHVYVPDDELRERVVELRVPSARHEAAVAELVARGMLVVESGAVYPPPLFVAERRTAQKLAALARPRPRPAGARAALERAFEQDLSASQREAVERSLEAGLLVLTGGPGTGKTTTVKAIVRAQLALDRRVVLAAPTGRAAKRLSEASGLPAKTIHRLLEWNPGTGSFRRGESEPIDADLVLVDEASMLDLRLADRLVAAVPEGSTLILVGDVDQLPPVGPGQVLRELLESGIATTVRLREVFRQAQESAIVRGAHAIQDGRLPEPSPPNTKSSGDLFFVQAQTADEVHEKLLRVLDRIRDAYGLDPRDDVQVLCPMRRGPLGTETLNQLLQKSLNTRAGGESLRGLRAGDKVMQLRNDYDRDVFNGDVGEVLRIEGGTTFVAMDGREVQYPPEELEALTLAYASTVHKVQGSEFPAVVVVLHSAHFVLLSRALLYTALTRGKRLVVLLGEKRAFELAVRNARTEESRSRLRARLVEARSKPD
ncbi:MAG: ATP-dependent RecD-like DNA helicase [Polyangiales bacterium]